MLKLSILDQSPISEGMDAETAIDNTVELTNLADSLGYHRFWVSEHHNTNSFASASPEIFISSLAAQTKNIKLGTAGILLSHYQPYKIAEQMSLLSTLYPNRIDLGIGRALGGDARIAKALNSTTNPNEIIDKFDSLINYLYKNKSGLKVIPQTEHKPELWILGTSPASAKYAAERGLRYSFASFINAEKLVESYQTYHQYFTPTEFLNEPYTNLSLFVLAAETNEEANKLASSAKKWLIDSLLYRKDLPFPKAAGEFESSNSMQEQFLIKAFEEFSAIGTAKGVLSKLETLKKNFAINEFTLVTITYDQKDKINSYKLIADENEK
ncbi:MAG: LLM class flavin-dependent oxidoreductase [Melioribacteraceae bacterium]